MNTRKWHEVVTYILVIAIVTKLTTSKEFLLCMAFAVAFYVADHFIDKEN